MMKLYFAPGASSMAPHIALHEIGVPFETEIVRIGPGAGPKSDDFLTLNPEGKVPVLAVDGIYLTEVLAILFYLGQNFPDARLLPASPLDQAKALSWMSFLASTVHPAWRQGPEHNRAMYQLADDRLGNRWALGEYSIVDIHLFRLFWCYAQSNTEAAQSMRNLNAHYERMMERPAVKRVLQVEASTT